MSGTASAADVQAFWQNAAKAAVDADGLRPTARDPYLQAVVEAAIEKWLKPGDRLLDVGCGDGHSTIRFAAKVASAVGIDYVADFIERAKQRTEPVAARCRFATGNVLDLSPVRAEHGRFDVVTTIRCLINLTSWNDQAKAIAELAACVKPGGLLLSSEGSTEHFARLNQRRRDAGLSSMPVAQYNLLMSDDAFCAEAGRYFEVVGRENLGFYLFMSRVFQPVYVAPAAPSHRHDINRVAATLQETAARAPDFADCDYAGVYVLRRKPD